MQETVKEFKPSPYQSKIFDFILNGTGNAVVSAVAGSGKTTTILKALNLISPEKNNLYLAFNAEIVKDIKTKHDDIFNTVFSTVHSYGYETLRRHRPEVTLDLYKYSNMLRNILMFLKTDDFERIKKYGFGKDEMAIVNQFNIGYPLDEDDNDDDYRKRITTLCNLGRYNLIASELELAQIAEAYSIDNFNQEVKLATYLMCLGEFYSDVIDYTDMIYFPIKYNLSGAKYDWVFIDECQDINVSQRVLMLKALKPTGRFLAVGDPYQSIYQFAGADFNSFQSLIDLPNTIELPLSVCYRCDEDILNFVKVLVPHIEFFDGNGKGVVNRSASKSEITCGDMVLCRNTYPLVRLCFDYLKKGIKATIKGRDIGKSLTDLIAKTKKTNSDEMFDVLYHELDKKLERLVRKYNVTEKEAKENQEYISYKEKIEVIELLSDDAKDPEEIIEKINKIFSDNDKSGIQLSTIHKAKGLEANRIFIIHPELMPSKYAKKAWELEQEKNIKYVAFSRAKNYLGFVIDFDAYGDRCLFDKSDKVNEVKVSTHVGVLAEPMRVSLKKIASKEVTTFVGKTMVHKFIDTNGNIYNKFGFIPDCFTSGDKFNNCQVIVTKHTEFAGVKENQISKMSTATGGAPKTPKQQSRPKKVVKKKKAKQKSR